MVGFKSDKQRKAVMAQLNSAGGSLHYTPQDSKNVSFDAFYSKVKQLFPNAEKNKVKQILLNKPGEFALVFGGISKKNSSDSEWSLAKEINEMSTHVSEEKSLLESISSKDKKLTADITRRAESGEMVRLI